MLKQAADEASESNEPQFISYLQCQCKSTDPTSLREVMLQRYSFYVEHVEMMPVGLSVLAIRADRVSDCDANILWMSNRLYTCDVK